MRVAISGGHRFDDWDTIRDVLDRAHESVRFSRVYIGMHSTGADVHVRGWARFRGVDWVTFSSARYLRVERVGSLLLFPHDGELASLAEEARELGIKVRTYAKGAA